MYYFKWEKNPSIFNNFFCPVLILSLYVQLLVPARYSKSTDSTTTYRLQGKKTHSTRLNHPNLPQQDPSPIF